jgi:hypothetical protein
MEPVYRASSKTGRARLPNVFWCQQDSVIARGRTRPRFA